MSNLDLDPSRTAMEGDPLAQVPPTRPEKPGETEGLSPERLANLGAAPVAEESRLRDPDEKLKAVLDEIAQEFPDLRSEAAIDRTKELVAKAFPELRSEAADRTTEVFALERDQETYYEILIKSEVKAPDYKDEVAKPVWDYFENQIQELKEELDGGSVWELSSTFEGGGVAMQVPPEINLLQQYGIDVHWGVAEPDSEAFEVTKKMHNGQQDVAAPGEELDMDFTPEDAEKHIAFGLKNLEGMWKIKSFREAKIYVFHDPQLVGMLPELKRRRPDAKFIYRNHIHTDRDKMAQKGSVQEKIKKHIHETCEVDTVDTYISHPVESFAPYGTENLAYQPPVSDLHEELNLEQTEEQRLRKLDWNDRQIVKQNIMRQIMNLIEYRELQSSGEEGLGDEHEWIHKDDQLPLDRDRPWLTGFARFDFAKAQHLNMRLHKLIVDRMRELNAPEELIPDTIIAGNGATDDPDRSRVLNLMMKLRRTEFADYKDHIKVFGTEHDYEAVSALTASSMFTVNFSIREGWEHRRAESMLKRVPSISSDAGGLPMQGADGEGGFVAELAIEDEELKRISEEVVQDLLDPERHQRRKEATRVWAETFIKPQLTTVPNAIRQVLILRGKGSTKWKMKDLVGAEPNDDEKMLIAA